MNVVVTVEQRFERTPDGALWTPGQYPYAFWTRYLDVFQSVRVVGRVRDVSDPAPDGQRVDGTAVTVAAVPDYLGPQQYARIRARVRQAIQTAITPADAIILRVPSQLATVAVGMLRRAGHPYAVEVVSDPWLVFAPGAVRHPLRPFFRRQFTRALQQQCWGAYAASYVTESALQARYPCPGYSVGVSDVQLRADDISAEPRLRQRGSDGRFRVLFVGTFAQLYKSPDVVVQAVALCVQRGLDLHLTMVGDGRHRSEIEALARSLHLGDRVEFTGQVPGGGAVRHHLDDADLFVLPSRHEGLPRAMIEAMARGLPCIGSIIGGIPELLPPEDLVPPGDVHGLANRILQVAGSPQTLQEMSIRNHQRAQEYMDTRLKPRQIAFYRHVRDVFAAHSRAQPNHSFAHSQV